MNTGKPFETKNLILLPSNNLRDNASFLKMLKADGDFRNFCGVEYSEAALSLLENYFDKPETCYYSIYRKVEPCKYIGHTGFYWKKDRCEIECYLFKPYRNNGYCMEAAEELIHFLFSNGLSVDGNIRTPDKIYSSVLAGNRPAIRVLEKMGFQTDTEGPAFMFYVAEDPCTGSLCDSRLYQYVLKRTEKHIG